MVPNTQELKRHMANWRRRREDLQVLYLLAADDGGHSLRIVRERLVKKQEEKWPEEITEATFEEK